MASCSIKSMCAQDDDDDGPKKKNNPTFIVRSDFLSRASIRATTTHTRYSNFYLRPSNTHTQKPKSSSFPPTKKK